MARDEFFDNIRDAVSLSAPVAEPVGVPLDPEASVAVVRRASIWLTPKAVEGFEPDDFGDLDPATREELAVAVEGFRDVAGLGSATGEQEARGWSNFRVVARLTRQIVREEWQREVGEIVEEAAGWCRERGWPAKTRVKVVADKFLGKYNLPQLLLHTTESQFLLDPVARYAAGTSGLIDLAVLPSCESARITRSAGKWKIHPIQGQGRPRAWSRASFLDAVATLGPLA